MDSQDLYVTLVFFHEKLNFIQGVISVFKSNALLTMNLYFVAENLVLRARSEPLGYAVNLLQAGAE
ncbi:hypothetical protein D1AOALGA4SA_2778 [Olavius algarvensis Delta 1 endosymbiont]|nr:hypothetical protein D1AOALGA4SA_2778 [Olavius algarvensis Delta 1 endosymbiont]